MTAVAILHREQIITQISQGVMLSEVARSLGVSAAAISQQLSHDPKYVAARESGIEMRLQQSLAEIDELSKLGVDKETGDVVGLSSQLLNLARVRADKLKANQWFAEREFPHRWGAKTELRHVGQAGPTINIVVSTPQSAPQHDVDGEVLSNQSS